MKRAKRSLGWEEPATGSPTEFAADPDDLDEEIIDLEEIIGPEADDVDADDELDFDAAILDADASPELREFEGSLESEEELFSEDDLLKEFAFLEDRKTEPELPQSLDIQEEKPEKFAFGLLLDHHEGVREEAESERETPISEEIISKEPTPPVEAAAEASDSLDDFVAKIEKRMVEMVRETVEARLPEIVRMVLREEIERLKSDPNP